MTEQIFLVGNILEEASEWRAGLYAHFVDYEKAFDSVHRESLWNIMRSYGITDKMVRMTAGVYTGFERAVVDGNVTSDWFMIKSGIKRVRDVGIPFLTVLGLGYEKGNSRQEKKDKVEFQVLEDHDFTDDIALLSSKFNDLHEKTGRLAEEAARAGLKLNARNCKTLGTEGASSREKIVVDDEEVDDVEELFTYLVAIVHKEGGGSKDITHRLQKARGGLMRLLVR